MEFFCGGSILVFAALGFALGRLMDKPVAGAVAGGLLGPVGLVIFYLAEQADRQPCPECAQPISKPPPPAHTVTARWSPCPGPGQARACWASRRCWYW